MANFFLACREVEDSDQGKREAVSVNLNSTAKKFIEQVRDETGVTKTEAIARILDWFSGLDRKLRLAVLNKDEPTKRELLRLALLEMAGMSKMPDASALPLNLDECLKLIHALTARAEELTRAYRVELSDRTKKK